MANLKLGGGKSVVIGNPRTQKTPQLLGGVGTGHRQSQGRYIAAEDSGTSVADEVHGRVHRARLGRQDKATKHGKRSGDPRRQTAYGTFVGIRAAVLGKSSVVIRSMACGWRCRAWATSVSTSPGSSNRPVPACG